jgi:DNA-binding NarL/FixJ family response regulator
MRILLADDHALVRCVFKHILETHFPDAEFGEAENCQQAVDAALAQSWDLVILDISMPGRGGLDVLKKIHAQRPKTPVLIVSMHAEQSFVMRAFRTGATGYLDKASTSHELIEAVERVLSGNRYISNALAEQWAVTLGCTPEDLLDQQLSNREFEVMRRIASGETVRTIAQDMLLSGNSIGTYRMRILKKMQMHTNADLTRYAIQNRLVA